MTKVIVVSKNSNKKETNIRTFSVDELYKKANLKNSDNFIKRNTWKVGDSYFSIYAKNQGRANNENKYDLPPPLDSQLYFGSLIIVKHSDEEITNENVVDSSLEEWEKVYEKLFGGFEDLNDNDSYSEEEEIPEKFKTKEGYSKESGFIVSSGEEEEDDDYIPQEEEEEYNSNSENDDESEELGDTDDLVDEDEEEDDEEEDDEEEDDEEDDEEDYDSDDIGSELSEDSYISDNE